MSRPTPLVSSAVPYSQRSPLVVATATPMGVRTVDVRPAPLRPKARGWMLLLAPPATAAAPVRSLHLGRWSPATLSGILAAVVVMLGAGAMIGGLSLERQATFADLTATTTALAEAELRASAFADTLRAIRVAAAALPLAEAARTTTVPVWTARRPAVAPNSRGALRPAPGVVLPVQVGRLSSGFARRRIHPILRINRPHLGLDMAAPKGTPIRAPAPGHVSFVGWKVGFGRVVEIKHEGGVVTRYAHCNSATVKTGQLVVVGETIATVGSSGLATAPHLHYEILVNGRAVDPLRYVFVPPAPAPVVEQHSADSIPAAAG